MRVAAAAACAAQRLARCGLPPAALCGTRAYTTRLEHDTLGQVEVSASRLWGAQTQRALQNFKIGDPDVERMPAELIRALGTVKRAAAQANMEAGLLSPEVGRAIMDAAGEVECGRLADHFPLPTWQTGSGTQSNMNANEVIANRAMQLLHERTSDGTSSTNSDASKPGPATPTAMSAPAVAGSGTGGGVRITVHPNDHVNLCQSSNDVIPTAMHVALARSLAHRLLPALHVLGESLERKAMEWSGVAKVGRTHLMDATLLTVGQEFGAWAAQVRLGQERVRGVIPGLLQLAIGGTAVGTGVNSWRGFGERVAELLAEAHAQQPRSQHDSLSRAEESAYRDERTPRDDEARTVALLRGRVAPPLAFRVADDHFEAQASHDAVVHAHGALNTLAVSLNKVANDVRLLASGPRCGLGELMLPTNEPGSSIMPGKVNPTQCEMVSMVCCQVMGHNVVVSTAGASGHLQLNAYKPVIIAAALRSSRLLADACDSFESHCVRGLAVDRAAVQAHAERSLMLVTALAPQIGYERAAGIAHAAHRSGRSLREAAAHAGVPADVFEQAMEPGKLLRPYELGKGKG